jgi:HlyD family secretion protein
MHSSSRFARGRLLVGCAFFVALGLSGCAHGKPQKPPPPYVATSVAALGTMRPTSSLAGVVAPYENVAIQTNLVEPTDGVYVQEGDTVHKGEVLAQLDTADLRAELAADEANASHALYQGQLSISQGADTLRQAETTLRTDELNLERDEALLRQGYIARQVADSQAELVHNDQQTVAADQANVSANGSLTSAGLQASSVAQAKAAAQQIRVQIAKATIVSPVDGVVVNRNLNPGEYPGNRQIFTIQQVNPIFAIVRGSGAQIAHIANGALAQVAASDLGDPSLSGKVVAVLNQIVPGSTDFMVKILLPNPQHRLRPGMTVQAQIALPVISGTRIPLTAFTDQNHTQVMTVNERGIVQVAHVTELGDDGVNAIVTGLASGTRVVSNGMAAVGAGEKVSTQ